MNDDLTGLRYAVDRAAAAALAARQVLAKHESSTSRVITVEQTYAALQGLSLLQQGLFEQAIKCVERGLYRAAHVMAWAAFIDLLEEQLASDGLVKLYAQYPAWARHSSMDDLREHIAEAQLIDAAKALALLSKNDAKTLQGLLSKRNECAHPSSHEPGLNEALGYISELLRRAAKLQSKTL